MVKKLYSELVQQIDQLPINYSDKAVLRFIAARTIRYDKIEERIPERHFLEGVNGTRPCGVERRTLKRSQLRLAEAGLVRVTHHRDVRGDLPNSYELQLNKIRSGRMGSKLKLSKKRVSPCSERSDRMSPGGCQNVTPEVGTLRVQGSDHKINTKLTTGKAVRGLEEAVEGAREKTREARRRKAGKLSKTRAASALQAAWTQACAEAFPDARPAYIGLPVAARFVTQTVNYLPTGDDMADFVSWAVTHWDLIRRHFSWMKKQPVPAYPDLGWCAHHCARLLTARGDIDARVGDRQELSRSARLELENARLKNELEKAKRSSPRTGRDFIRDVDEAIIEENRGRKKPRPTIDLRLEEIPDLPPNPYERSKR